MKGALPLKTFSAKETETIMKMQDMIETENSVLKQKQMYDLENLIQMQNDSRSKREFNRKELELEQ